VKKIGNLVRSKFKHHYQNSYRLKIHLIFLALFCTLLYNSKTYGQAKKNTPKIGLVLSGGGARGMAHIGVLKALERVGIYPDVVTGTSMGSVVGGLYSLGYTADEIEKIANESDWDALLSNLVPFKEIAIEEKPYYWRYIFELPVRGMLPELPSGVIEGENLYKLFSQLTRSAHGISDFDQLPIPFRCVATDIVTGEKVVMKGGSLAESIRASMAIPSIFTPVEIDEHLLVDGGLVRNFPVEEAKEMGADIIIGVSVSEGLVPKEQLSSLTDILIQSSWLMSEFDSREQRKMVDVYIEPNLQGYSTADFNKSAGIISRGTAIGQEFLPELESLADSLRAIGKVFKKPSKLPQLNAYPIQNVMVRGGNRIPSSFILGKLRIHAGDTLEIEDINERLREVYGTQYFSKIEYEIIKRGGGYDLLVKVKEKPQVYLKGALYYNSETRAGLNVNLTARNKFWPNSRLLAEIDFSENFRTEFSFLKYLGRKQNAAATLGYQSLDSQIPLFEGDATVAIFDDYDHNFFLMLQTTKRSTSSTGLRFDANIKRYKPEISGFLMDILSKIKEESVSASVFYTANTLNDPIIPTAGLRFDASLGYKFYNNIDFDLLEGNEVFSTNIDSTFAVESHPQFNLSLKYFLPLSSKVSLFTDSRLSYIPTTQTGLGSETGIGGFYINHPSTTPFWGADFYQFQQLSFAIVRFGVQVEPINDLFIIGGMNYADSKYPVHWFDRGHTPETFNNRNNIWGGGLQILYNTNLGPVGVAIGKLQGSETWQTGINIGFWY